MIIFDNSSASIRLYEANKKVNQLLINGVIQKALTERKENFEYSNVTCVEIAGFINEYMNDFDCKVELYKPRWRWSKAYATTYTGNYRYIGINSRKANRSTASLAGSIAHEWGHCLEYYVKANASKTIFFNHGDNSPVNKDNTFQYWLGRLVKQFLDASN